MNRSRDVFSEEGDNSAASLGKIRVLIISTGREHFGLISCLRFVRTVRCSVDDNIPVV